MFTTKFLWQAFSAVLVALVPVLADNEITAIEWLNVAVIGFGAITVYVVPNIPQYPYAKVIVSAVSTGLALAVSLITDGMTLEEWLQIAVAVGGTLAVYKFKNNEDELSRGRHARVETG